MRVINARNVGHALHELVDADLSSTDWRQITVRGEPTTEHVMPVATVYERPTERVVFSSTRDANPFFHFFEALWMLDGRRDVEWLARFNSNIASYSDDGQVFNAAYGYRIRKHFQVDQLLNIIELLAKDPNTRRAVIGIWDPAIDLNPSKDIPCNDLIMFKLRDNRLGMTVSCRSNDAIWGAYGANAVHFSMIQEFVARALGVEVGTYTQVSDSFHVYHTTEVWKRLKSADSFEEERLYDHRIVSPYPMMNSPFYSLWLQSLREFMRGTWQGGFAMDNFTDPFFTDVALPLFTAYQVYKNESDMPDKRIRVRAAIRELAACRATDWRLAGQRWLSRRSPS